MIVKRIRQKNGPVCPDRIIESHQLGVIGRSEQPPRLAHYRSAAMGSLRHPSAEYLAVAEEVAEVAAGYRPRGKDPRLAR